MFQNYSANQTLFSEKENLLFSWILAFGTDADITAECPPQTEHTGKQKLSEIENETKKFLDIIKKTVGKFCVSGNTKSKNHLKR
jgi:hypothetical protein